MAHPGESTLGRSLHRSRAQPPEWLFAVLSSELYSGILHHPGILPELDDFQTGLEAALDSISLSRWPDEQDRIVLALSTAVMDSGIVAKLRESILKEAEAAATEALY